MVYEALDDISRVRCWSIPRVVAQDGVIRAFFELWLGIASVLACVLQVLACRLDNNDSLRLSTKDIEHGLHGGGHV